jgi:hypothetical protein
MLNLKEKHINNILDIVTEQYELAQSGSNVVITVKSLGHSQFACSDYAVGSRFGAHATVIMLHDMGTRSSIWFEHIQVALSLYDAGFDLLWFDVEDFRSDPGQLSLIFNKYLRSLLVHLGVRRAMTFAAGFGAGIFLELLADQNVKLFETMHFNLNPDTPKPLRNLTNQLRANKIQIWSGFWLDHTRPSTGSTKQVLSDATVTLNVERQRLITAKKAAKTYDAVIMGQFTPQISSLEIKDDTLSRRITVFNEKLLKSITAYFTEGREGFLNVLEDHFVDGNTLFDHLKAKQQQKQLQHNFPQAVVPVLVSTQKPVAGTGVKAAETPPLVQASSCLAVAPETLKDPTYDEESQVFRLVQILSKETADTEFQIREERAKIRSKKDHVIAEKVETKLLERTKTKSEEESKVQQALKERGAFM